MSVLLSPRQIVAGGVWAVSILGMAVATRSRRMVASLLIDRCDERRGVEVALEVLFCIDRWCFVFVDCGAVGVV